MTVVADTIAYLKMSGQGSDKRVEGKDYKPLPSYKQAKKAKRQHLPI